MSFRDNLEGFLAHAEHVRNLLARGEDGYQQEFTALKTQSQRYKTEKTFATKAGEYEANIRKNRYKDILPFDYTRIKLPEVEGVAGSDYINASFVKGYSGKHTYVAAQGPLPHTVNDFWRMIWEAKAMIIVMSCNEYEMGKHKCERYWVDEGEIKEFDDIKVTMISQRRVHNDFLIRTLKVKRASEEERVINQFHYTAWPDHGVPNSVLPIIEMVKLVREYQPHDDIPLLIHCSAGCGRTGTICVIDFVFNQLRAEAIGSDFSLYELVQEMRRQRPAMVQTRDQYELVHRAVASMFNKLLEDRFADYSRVYENVHLKPQVDKPRMPPAATATKSSHSPNQQRKRHSDHNYVNAMPGQIEGDMVRVPTIPGSKVNRPHSIPVDNAAALSASLDVPIYANMGDELEKDMQDDAAISPKAELSRKFRTSLRKSKETFSQLDDILNTADVPSSTTTPPLSPPLTSPKPVIIAKPSFPPSKPVVSAKPSNGGGAKPPTLTKPNVNSSERPVPMQRKHKPKPGDVKPSDRSASPIGVGQNIVFGAETRKTPPNPVARTPKDGALRSISVDPSIPADRKRIPSNPQVTSLEPPRSKQFENQLASVIGKKPGEVRPRSFKRPGVAPPKTPSDGVPPKPPPASAKPTRYEYEPVSLQPPKKETDNDNKVDSRLAVHVTPVQKTNLRRFSDDENAKEHPILYAQSMRRKQEESKASLDPDIRPRRTIQKQQPSVRNAGVTSGFSDADVYDEITDPKYNIAAKEPPAKPSRGKQTSAISAYEIVAPMAPGRNVSEDAFDEGMNDATYGQYNDVDYMDDDASNVGVYGTYNDVEYLQDKRDSNVGLYGQYKDVEYVDDKSDMGSDIGVYGQNKDVDYMDDKSDMGTDVGVYGQYKDVDYMDDKNDLGTDVRVYGQYKEVDYMDDKSDMSTDVGVYGQYKDVDYMDDNTESNEGVYGFYSEVQYVDDGSKTHSRSKNAPPDTAPCNPADSRENSNVAAGRGFSDVNANDGPPALPERTQESYELVDDNQEPSKDQEPSAAAGGKGLKFKEFYNRKKDQFKDKSEGLKAGTKGLLVKLGDAVKRPDTSSPSQSSGGNVVQNPPSGPPPRPPPQINQAEIIEKTLKGLEKQPDQPIIYNNEDISYPNRVAKPKPPRQQPQEWANRAQVSYVPL